MFFTFLCAIRAVATASNSTACEGMRRFELTAATPDVGCAAFTPLVSIQKGTIYYISKTPGPLIGKGSLSCDVNEACGGDG